MAEITYVDHLQLFRIFWPLYPITEETIQEAKKRGWALYMDGHGQTNGLLNAPKEALSEVEQLFQKHVANCVKAQKFDSR
jgi:hypothetical protein